MVRIAWFTKIHDKPECPFTIVGAIYIYICMCIYMCIELDEMYSNALTLTQLFLDTDSTQRVSIHVYVCFGYTVGVMLWRYATLFCDILDI